MCKESSFSILYESKWEHTRSSVIMSANILNGELQMVELVEKKHLSSYRANEIAETRLSGST